MTPEETLPEIAWLVADLVYKEDGLGLWDMLLVVVSGILLSWAPYEIAFLPIL